MPDQKSAQQLNQFLQPILEEANTRYEDPLYYDSYDWHMTLRSIETPDHLSKIQFTNRDTDAMKYIDKKIIPKIKNITDDISKFKFKINGVSTFGGDRNKFIVLTLEPILNTGDKEEKKIKKRILNEAPHISIARFKVGPSLTPHAMNELYIKILNEILPLDIKFTFNKTIAEVEKDRPIATYSTSQPSKKIKQSKKSYKAYGY